jgi:hypothetical protein
MKWSLTLREEHKLQASENKCARKYIAVRRTK